MDRLLINARIATLDPARPAAAALAIRGERIFALGDEALRALAERTTRVDDMGGAFIYPGFVDAHLHWQWTAMGLTEIDLMDLPSKEAAIARVAAGVAAARPGVWVRGRGWAQADWPGGAFPTAQDLDPVAPDHPVFLKARSGHAAWVNAAALRLAGITDSTPDPADGVIQRDGRGHATGILLESAIEMVESLIPPPTPEELADRLYEAQRLFWAAGMTGLHDYDGPRAFEAMQILRQTGRLGLRVVKNINDPYIDHAIALGLRWGFGDDWLRLGGLKIFADGALGPRTALMIDPYEGEPSNRGVSVTDKETMYELVSRASRAGFPATIHAIGDRAVHDVLDVYEAVRKEESAAGVAPQHRRHRIEHVQLIHPGDGPRLAALDVIASMQPIHATSDYRMSDAYWGARSRYAYNARLQIDAGARVAFGSDSPVESYEPLRGMHAAVTRRRPDGSPSPDGWYPELRLSVNEALRGYTQGPAYAAGMEHHLGKLAPRFLADLVVLDRDLMAIPPDDILKARVLGTMTGGTWRFTDGLRLDLG
ncbi:MAG: amidohydrolase [Anaerolineae bacterium]|nr:amidohydrolase [Anaerolineae bacterium]